jgi:hypothetical protein
MSTRTSCTTGRRAPIGASGMRAGWAKLRYLEHLLSPDELERVRWRNAAAIFPAGAFPSD